MPPAVVISVVVFLLVLAALCGVLAIWTIVTDLRSAGSPRSWAPAAHWVIEVPPVAARPTIPLDLRDTRLLLPPRARPRPTARDDDEEDDFTEVEVDDGVTTIRDPRFALRR